MISVEEAILLIEKHMPQWGLEKCNLNSFQNELIEEQLFADRDYPPCNRVMMDGIAVNYNSYFSGQRNFRILGVCQAGEPEAKLMEISGCFEVMTGSPLPTNTSLVIPYEHLSIENGLATINFETDRPCMDNVHLKGSDALAGDIVLHSKQYLDGPTIGIAASVGVSHFQVKKRPRINIISTGDELVDITEVPKSHQIRRSNIYALSGSLKLYGYTEIELSHVSDNQREIQSHYLNARENFDVLFYSGGVSKGKFDYLPKTLKDLGVKEVFHGISQRPGKPLWFGVDESSNTFIFGLPGNPISSLVCLHKYFFNHFPIYVEISEDVFFKKDLTYFLPVKIEFSRDGKIIGHPLKIKNSGEFLGLAGSDGFIELPKKDTHFRKGECFLFHPWRPF